MISYYQELLNECIDIQERKNNIEMLSKINKFVKGEKEKMGKHFEEMQQIKNLIEKKNEEIFRLETEIVSILQQIRNVNESNNYGNTYVTKRKINEICSDSILKFLTTEEKNRTTYDKPKQ